MTTRTLKFNPFLCLLLLTFIFSSCSNDDDSIKNQAPNAFDLINVADGASNVELQPQLTWETATDPDGDNVTYQVYMDTENPPRISIASNLGVSAFSLEDRLQPENIYYWRVVAKDSNGNSTESNVASFTSREMTVAEAIVGKWFIESVEGGDPLTTCDKQSFFQFTEDLFIQIKSYNEDSNGDCVESSTESTTYEIIGNDQINVVSPNDGTLISWDILSLTETNLVLNVNGSVFTLTKE